MSTWSWRTPACWVAVKSVPPVRQTVTLGTPHLLTDGVATPFTASYVSRYSTTNGIVALQTVSGSYAVVMARDVGAGHVVVIGTDYFTLGTGMDRIIANAVEWAQGPGFSPVEVSPTMVTLVNGVWTGDVAVLQAGDNMFLRVDDLAGHVRDSNTFNVLPLTMAVTVPADVTEGAGTVAGSVSIPTTLDRDLAVNLTSGNPDRVSVPTSVTILAGLTSADFDLTINDNSLLDGLEEVTIHAVASSVLVDTGTITVHDNETATLTVSLPPSAGG